MSLAPYILDAPEATEKAYEPNKKSYHDIISIIIRLNFSIQYLLLH